uniref:DNA topoisomerase n=1 Tax=Globodera rostochiensis TaxID=31243 RepID=A0A914GZJ2_GLORO
MNVLMVAEKPIVAEEIANILSDGKCSIRTERNGCSVFEYNANFRGKSANFRVTSTFGHMMCLDFPEDYQRTETDPDKNMRDFLASEAEDCDFLVLWLDCDKEGENICFEVIDAVWQAMNGTNGDGRRFMELVFRARFSAITEKEIKNAMSSLARPNIDESLAVDARQELDLRIGCAFTRFQNDYFKNKYFELDKNIISFGPCQTPTLAFCVERHDEIVHFKPQPYWLLQAEVELPGSGGGGICRTLKLEWCRERQLNRGVAQTFFNKVKNCTEATVSDLSSEEHQKEKPDALNTFELLRVYTRGCISYPRTETSAYPDSFDFFAALRELAKMPKFRESVDQILSDGILKPKGGTNKGDHPPITPKRVPSWLNEGCARVHEYIVQHFLATLMRPCKYLTKTVKFDIGGEQFQFQCRVVTDPGFTTVLNWLAVAQDQTMADNAPIVGQRIAIKKVDMIERMTAPPDYLTESELISLMEKYGIGTDGSIPTHINTIYVRKYVTVEQNRQLVPTKLGIALIHGYRRVDPDQTLLSMRMNVERQMELIANGEADYATIKKQTIQDYHDKYIHFVKNIRVVDVPFAEIFTAKVDSDTFKFRNYRSSMKMVETSRPQRLFCPKCKNEKVSKLHGAALSFTGCAFCKQHTPER